MSQASSFESLPCKPAGRPRPLAKIFQGKIFTLGRPFGASHSISWTRETATPNPYLYNAGSELNEKTGWYETAFRGYDAYTGRFQQVDPLADMFGGLNPYHYGYNNPTNFNDPMGLWPWGKKNSGGGNEKNEEHQDASTGAGQNSQTPMNFPEFTDLFNPGEYAAAAYGESGGQFGGGFASGAYYGVGSGQGSLAHQQFVNRNGGHAYYTNANYYDYLLDGGLDIDGNPMKTLNVTLKKVYHKSGVENSSVDDYVCI